MNKVGEALIPIEARTDEKLVSLVLTGEADVFAHVYERYYSRTYRLVYGMTGRHETAEDLTREIFIRAYQKLALFAGQSSFATWFYRLAFNHCLNRCKSAPRRDRGESDEAAPATGEFSAAGSMTSRRAIHTATRLANGRIPAAD